MCPIIGVVVGGYDEQAKVQDAGAGFGSSLAELAYQNILAEVIAVHFPVHSRLPSETKLGASQVSQAKAFSTNPKSEMAKVEPRAAPSLRAGSSAEFERIIHSQDVGAAIGGKLMLHQVWPALLTKPGGGTSADEEGADFFIVEFC